MALRLLRVETVEIGRECDECGGEGADCWLCRGRGYVVVALVPGISVGLPFFGRVF